MELRHLCAEFIRDGVLESLRRDPPDNSLVELRFEDFSRAFVPNKETGMHNEELRRFLLFRDKSEEVQKGLVIFINNAMEVFAARSCQMKDTPCLDSFLAQLFANMKVGGRVVTLTDISGFLSGDWFRRDVFESGTHAVSWGGSEKSIEVFVLTKLRDVWFCQSKNCKAIGASTAVVDEQGDLIKSCVCCDAPARRCPRYRKPSKRQRGEDS